MTIGNVWAENFYVMKANLLHKNVHQGDRPVYSRNKKVLHAVSVYHDDFDLYGVCDCLELKQSRSGALIDGDTYALIIVEHKPTKPKGLDYHYDDAMQVFAQKVCVDYVFKTKASAYLYYADVKKRVPLAFDELYEEFQRDLQSIIEQMDGYMKRNEIPPIKKGQKCDGCSFKDVCMPKIKAPNSIKAEIYKSLEEEV